VKQCLNCRQVFAASDWCCPACGWNADIIDGFPALAPTLARGGAGFEADWFAELADLERDSFWFSARTRLILWALKREFADARDLLEVGCGTGWVLAAIARARPEMNLVGSEVFSAGLRVAAERAQHAKLLQMDARQIPFEAEFDVVGAFDVLEHIAEDSLVLAELRRALRPGGGLLLTVPQHRWLWSEADTNARHVRRYGAAELHAKIIAAGFTILCSTSFVALLLPLMLASRAAKRGQPRRGAAPATTELRLPRIVNVLLGAVMTWERQAIYAGVRFPAGGSRIVVARAV
jgi:SAM-dependent methyltransferase